MNLTIIFIYIICFAMSIYALTCISFDRFCNVKQPWKVQLLVFLLAMALAYLCAQFILALTIFNGLMI